MANQFLVSVAEAIGLDPNTGEGLFYGKTNITSSFGLTMASTEVRGGIGNQLLYTYLHDRKVDIKVEAATFSQKFLGLNVGQLATSAAVEVLKTELKTLVNNATTCSLTPLSDVVVFYDDGTIEDVTPVGSVVTTSAGGSETVTIVYTASITSDQIVVSSTTPPNVVDMYLIAEVRDNTGVIVDYLQINIPRYQVTGNYNLALAANGVSTEALEGTALVATEAGVDYYAKISWIPAAAASDAVTSIVALPSTLSFTASASQTDTISVLGIRSSGNTNVTTSCSFVSSSGSFAVGLHTGVVSVSASNANLGASGSVTATYWDTVNSASLVDYVNLIVE